MFILDPDLYDKFKDAVLELTNAVQIDIQEHLPEGVRKRGLSDKEIAERIGLDEQTVAEIRCVAERDSYPLEEFLKAAEFKQTACRRFAQFGVSHAFKSDLYNSANG